MWFTILSILSSMHLIAGFPCWDSDHCAPDNETCDERLTKGTVTWDQYLGTATKGTSPKKLKVSLQQTASDYCKMENGPWIYESTCALYNEYDSTPTVFVAKECPKDTVCALGQCVEPTTCEDPDNDFAYSKNAQYFTKDAVTETKGNNPPGPPIPDKCNAAPDHPQLLAEKICVAIPGGAKLDTEYVDCAQWNATCDNGACVCTSADCKLPCVDYIGPTELGKFVMPEKLAEDMAWCDQIAQSVNELTWPGGAWFSDDQMDFVEKHAKISLPSDSEDIHSLHERCVTHSDPAVTDTDSDGEPDNFELQFQDTQLHRRYNGMFYSEFGETNPLRPDTDGDGQLDSQDSCPLNGVLACTADTCTPPPEPPWLWHCTASQKFSEDFPNPGNDFHMGLARIAMASGSGYIFAATGSAVPEILRSNDGGESWEKVLDPADIKFSISPSEAAYFPDDSYISVTTNGQKIRARTGQLILESDNFGEKGSWSLIGTSIPQLTYLTNQLHYLYITPDGMQEYAFGSLAGLGKRLAKNDWEWILKAGAANNPLVQLDITTFFTDVGLDSSGEKLLLAGSKSQGMTGIIDLPTQKILFSKAWEIFGLPSVESVKLAGDNAIVSGLSHLDPARYHNMQSGQWFVRPTQSLAEEPGLSKSMSLSGDGSFAVAKTEQINLWVSHQSFSNPVGNYWYPIPLWYLLNNTLPPLGTINDIVAGPGDKTFLIIGDESIGMEMSRNYIYQVTCK